MDWISWSRTWATTRRTTTTSRTPLRRSRKNSCWKRMYLLLQADQRLKQNHENLLLPAHVQELYLSVKDLGLILSQKKIIRSRLPPVLKQLSTLLRHGDLPREEDGAIEFWRLKDNLRNEFVHSQHWSMARDGGINFFNIVVIRQDRKFFFSKLFKVIQDAISLILHYMTMYQFRTISSSTLLHRMCNQFTLHYEFWIDTGRTNFEQKTHGILYVWWSYEQRTQRPKQNWPRSTASCKAGHHQKKWKKKHGVIGRDKFCSKERIQVLSNKIERNHLYDTLPAYCILKALMMETGEIIYEKCKEYISHTGKFYAIWLRRKRQQQHERWD